MNLDDLWMPEDVRPRVSVMNAKELLGELINDAVRIHPTEINRFVEAIKRISQLEKCTPEQAFQMIVKGKADITGDTRMPVYA